MALANYTDFVKPYQDGYANGESGGTPVTAEILNTNYDAFLIALNTWAASVGTEIGNKVDKVTGKQLSDENYSSTEKTKLAGIAEGATAVVANPPDSSSTNLTKIKIGGSVYLIPQGGGSGSSVVWTQIQQSGTKIATISIDGTDTDVYAPNGGSGGGDSVSWSQVVQSGTKIGTITINNTPTDVYVPAVPTKTSDLTNDSNFVSDASYVHTDNNYTTTEKNKLADLNQVEANPSSGTSAGDLSTISIGGTKYDIPSGGGGGTTVVANPSGTATDELEKLQVGSTIYSIPSGGSGGGSGFQRTNLYTATSEGVTTIPLSDSIANYDLIEVICWYYVNDTNYTQNAIYNAQDLIDSISGTPHRFVVCNDSMTNWFDVTDVDELTSVTSSFYIKEVYGYKFGGSETDVTGTLTAGSTSITLSDNSITTSSTIEVFNELDIPYNSKTLSTGSITLTFDAQQSDMAVKVRVS